MPLTDVGADDRRQERRRLNRSGKGAPQWTKRSGQTEGLARRSHGGDFLIRQ